MRSIKERSERHGEKDDYEKLFASDVSALKKLQVQEKNYQKLTQNSPDSPRKDENFAGRDSKRKNLKKPTASEQRNIQKLFRRKEVREAAMLTSD